MNILGIDPGLSGAFVVIDPTKKRILEAVDMPRDRESHAHGHLDPHAINRTVQDFFFRFGCELRVGIEWPHMRPGEGAERARNFGLGLGYLHMAVLAAGREPRLVDPGGWKSRLGIPGKTTPGWQEIALKLARVLYPDDLDVLYPGGRLHDGRLDAALIAEFVWRKHGGWTKDLKDDDASWLRLFGGGTRKPRKGGPII